MPIKRKKNRTNNFYGPVLGDPWVTLFEMPAQADYPHHQQPELAIEYHPWGENSWKIHWNDAAVSSERGWLELYRRDLYSGEVVWETRYVNFTYSAWQYREQRLATEPQRREWRKELIEFAQEIGLPMIVVGPYQSRRWRFNSDQAFIADFTKLGFRVPQTHFKSFDNCLIALYNIPTNAVLGRKG